MNMFPPNMPIPGTRVAPLFRVICPDGHVSEDVDTIDAARDARTYANDMHDQAICRGTHRILAVDTYIEIT